MNAVVLDHGGMGYMQGNLIRTHAKQANDEGRTLPKIGIAFHGRPFELDQHNYMQFEAIGYQIYNLALRVDWSDETAIVLIQ